MFVERLVVGGGWWVAGGGWSVVGGGWWWVVVVVGTIHHPPLTTKVSHQLSGCAFLLGFFPILLEGSKENVFFALFHVYPGYLTNLADVPFS